MLRMHRVAAVLAVACLVAGLNWQNVRAAAPYVFTVAQAADATTLDPWNTGANAGLGIERAFFEGLFGFNPTMKVLPVLAKSFTVSPDGLTYTFTLQSGVTFHDGTPFNAQAVKANFDRVLDPANHLQKYGLYHTVSHVQAVTVVDDHTVKMTVSAPSATLINNLAHPSAVMISPTALAKYGNAGIASNPVGTGPFVFQSWAHGDRIVARRNPSYWRPGLTSNADQIVFRAVPDATQAIAMLKTGEAQFIYPIDPVDVKAISDQKNIKIFNAPGILVTYLSMNEHYAPFSKPNVRLAMNLAVDKQALISTLYLGYAKEMHSAVGSQLAGYAAVGTYPYNVAKAKALLAESGYPNGFDATLWVGTATFAQKVAVFLQQQLSQIGVRINVVPMEAGTLNSVLYLPADTNKGQLAYFGFSPSNGATDWALRSELSTAAFPPALFNVSFYTNPKVEALLAASEQTTADAQRNANYKQIQQIVFQDAPWVWLAEPTNVWAYSSNVSNVYVLPDQTVQVQYAQIH